MSKRILAVAAFSAAFGAVGTATAAELLIINLLPGTSQWYVNGRMVATVDADDYSRVQAASGPATIQVMDENADGETRTTTFDPAGLAMKGGQSFWCIGARSDDATGRPKVVVMAKPSCQKAIESLD